MVNYINWPRISLHACTWNIKNGRNTVSHVFDLSASHYEVQISDLPHRRPRSSSNKSVCLTFNTKNWDLVRRIYFLFSSFFTFLIMEEFEVFFPVFFSVFFFCFDVNLDALTLTFLKVKVIICADSPPWILGCKECISVGI